MDKEDVESWMVRNPDAAIKLTKKLRMANCWGPNFHRDGETSYSRLDSKYSGSCVGAVYQQDEFGGGWLSLKTKWLAREPHTLHDTKEEAMLAVDEYLIKRGYLLEDSSYLRGM